MKKKTWSKGIAVLLSASMLSASLTGCNSKETTEQSVTTPVPETSGENSMFNEPGTLPIAKEPITLTVFAPAKEMLDYTENRQIQELEKATNIRLEFQMAPSTDSIKEKLSTMFASGQTPDIICTGVDTKSRYDKATEAMLAAQGQILPLDGYLDTVSVGYKQAFEEFEGMREYITSIDGHIYSLPNVDPSYHIQFPSRVFINTIWLERLGLKKPTTTEELYQVLRAFKEQDANGNGDSNDEIPLTCVTKVAQQAPDAFLMQPFQLTPYGDKLYLEEGKVTFAPVQEGYKEGLKYLNKLYKEGLMTPESFTQDNANQITVNESGDNARYGAVIGMHPGIFASINESDRWLEYESIPYLTQPGMTVEMPNMAYTIFQTGMTFVSSSCKNPEAAFRLLDYLATPEQVMRSYYGVEGEHYVLAKEGQIGIDGSQGVMSELPNTLEEKNFKLEQLMCLVRRPYMVYGKVVDSDNMTPNLKRDVMLYNDATVQKEVGQSLETVLPDLYMSMEDAEEMSMIKSTLMNAQTTGMVDFITGAVDIDEGWDDYVSSLENTGLVRYIELLQNAYDNSAFAK